MDPITNKEDFYYYRAKFYFQRKDFTKAIYEFEKGLRINADSIVILYELAMCYMELGNYQKAIELFQKVKRVAPFSIHAVNSSEILVELNKKFKKVKRSISSKNISNPEF